MIQVQCPSCAKSYRVDEAKVGNQARCKGCGNTFSLTMSVNETHSPPDDSASKLPPVSSANSDNGFKSTPVQVAHYVLKRKLGAGAMGFGGG